MKSSKAPDGYYTKVEIRVRLFNDHAVTYVWDTPMGLAQASHKSLGWAKEEMTKECVAGRSAIKGYTITVQYYPGEYDNI